MFQRSVDKAVDAQPETSSKLTNTDKKYLFEGDQEVAKRGNNMLTSDMQLVE